MQILRSNIRSIYKFEDYVRDLSQKAEPWDLEQEEVVSEDTKWAREHWTNLCIGVFDEFCDIIWYAEECQSSDLTDEELYEVVDALDAMNIIDIVALYLEQLYLEQLTGVRKSTLIDFLI